MKATCEILEVYKPVYINIGGEDVPVVSVLVTTVEEQPSTFMLSIWGAKAVKYYKMKPGEHYRIEFVMKGQYCQDGQFRLQQIKLIRAKRKHINDDLYIIVKIDSGVMKVGRSINPQRRLEELQTSSEEELILDSQYEGGGYLEADIHDQLKRAGYHIKGEWFRYVPGALKIIENVYQMRHGGLD